MRRRVWFHARCFAAAFAVPAAVVLMSLPGLWMLLSVLPIAVFPMALFSLAREDHA